MEEIITNEAEILKYLIAGYSERDIALLMNISHHTVKAYIINIRRKNLLEKYC